MAGVDGKKRIGIIGYGGFGEFIHKAWNEMDNARVVAICDENKSRDPGGVEFYDYPACFLSNDEVDIVSIATPPSTHKELAIRSMRAGKHVLIEKPLALSEADALEIEQASRETGMVATVNFVLRYNPIVELLRQIVKSEVLGKIRRLDLRNYAMQETVPEGHWFWDPAVGGRILLEHGVHFFDLANYVMGAKAVDTWSLGVERKPGMEDRVFAAVKYDNDAIGTYWHSFSRPRELETTTFHFAFDLGEIEMTGWIPLELGIWGWTDKAGFDKISELLGDSEAVARKIDSRDERSSEFTYHVDYELNTAVELEEPKLDVYAENLRDIMADFIAKIDDPAHKLKITLDDAIEAVRVAEKATKFAHPD